MRLDKYLVEYKNIETRSKALDLIKRELVKVNDKIITKAGYIVSDSDLVLITDKLKYVSRAGLKLEYAMKVFNFDVSGKIVCDIGTSTGGFSDYCIQNNAKFVYGYDVGSMQLSDKLKNVKNLEVHENTNILDINDFSSIDLFVIDVSFVSIKKIINHIHKFKKPIIALVKPQFEVGLKNLKKGIVINKKTAINAVNDVKLYANKLGYNKIQYVPSNLPGKKGNLEYVMFLDVSVI